MSEMPSGSVVILRGLVGSTVHGLALEGADDRDEMAVAVPPPEYVLGLRTWEASQTRTRPEGERSGPGDLDLITYSARKFVRLVLAGNPSLIVLLFSPDESLSIATEEGELLRRMRDLLVSREAGPRFLGYLRGQRERLLGERGQKRTKRPELEEAFGYDTKYAMHALRLGYQGIELLTSGRITLPMAERERELLLQVRRGEVSFEDVIYGLRYTETVLSALVDGSLPSELRAEPDRVSAEQFLIWCHESAWREKVRVSWSG